MTTQSLAADVLDALLAAWRADATLTAYGDRLHIFDGPPITDRSHEIELWVGATGLEAEETVITGTQNWATLDQALNRDEQLDVTNAIWIANGNNDISAARRLAITVFNAAAGAIRGSDLGLSSLDDTTHVTDWQLHQGQFSSGVGAVLQFTVHTDGVV